MNYYTGFGLNIESEYPLPGARPGTNPEYPVVQIRKARAGLRWSELTNRCDAGDFLVGELPGVLDFFIWNGRRILMRPAAGADLEEAEFLIRTMSANFALALILRQRGYLTLHASVLTKNGTTFAFVGDSGWGKSTLAEFFFQNGYTVLSDDVGALHLDSENEDVYAIPGHPFVKLRHPAALAFLQEEQFAKREEDGRVHLTKPPAEGRRFTVNGVFVLRPHFADKTLAEKLGPRNAVLELMSKTHGSHLLTRPDYKDELLKQCSKLVNRVPVLVLNRRPGLDKLSEVLRLAENTFSS